MYRSKFLKVSARGWVWGPWQKVDRDAALRSANRTFEACLGRVTRGGSFVYLASLFKRSLHGCSLGNPSDHLRTGTCHLVLESRPMMACVGPTRPYVPALTGTVSMAHEPGACCCWATADILHLPLTQWSSCNHVVNK